MKTIVIILSILNITSCNMRAKEHAGQKKQGLPYTVIQESDQVTVVNLQQGDLLFRSSEPEKLSEAIDRVTRTLENTGFSHMGIVESPDDNVLVLHSTPGKGTCRETLHEFMHPKGTRVEVTVYRLKEPWQKTIPAAIGRAKKILGKPYNSTYVLSDTAYYCSDFIYRIFAPDSVFRLEPMTFKDPATGEFNKAWIEHYKKLEIEIPEGQPGCNPNGMAASEKLERLGALNPNFK